MCMKATRFGAPRTARHSMHSIMKPLPLCLAFLGLWACARAQDNTLTARNETGCGELNAVCCQLQINREQGSVQDQLRGAPRRAAAAATAQPLPLVPPGSHPLPTLPAC